MSENLAFPALAGKPVFIVDSWPVLEFLYRHEPARSRFIERLEAADRGDIHLLISRINFGEITYNLRIKERLGQIEPIQFAISDLPWQVLSVDDLLVDEATELKGTYPISYADAFVAALARRHRAPVITGDRDFLRLASAGVVTLDWIGA